MGKVIIPYRPREHFAPLHDMTARWGAVVAHRRAGKTVACVNHLIRAAATCTRKDPRFAYIAPLHNQAKDVAWEYVKYYTAPVVEHGGSVNESELRVDLPNGGRIRLYGADNPDRLRGIYLDGVVLDEYGTMDPRIWEAIRPALSDRQGWCLWIGTPRGHNDFHRVWQQSQADPERLALMLRASETGILPQAELDQAAKDLSPEQYAQEYECSFEAAVMGAYYGKEMERAEKEGRISNVAYDDGSLVHTAWDLGIGDSTAIWFCQRIGKEWRFIDYLEGSGVGLDWYVHELQGKRYNYGEHVFPHDVANQELTSGKTRKEVLQRLGIKVNMCPKMFVEDGIQQVRSMLGQSWFDRTKCERGVEALKLYRRDFDDKNKAFKSRPVHDWTSHPSDAMRYAAIGIKGGDAIWRGDYNKFGGGIPSEFVA